MNNSRLKHILGDYPINSPLLIKKSSNSLGPTSHLTKQSRDFVLDGTSKIQ